MSASNDALTTRLEESELRGSQIKKKRMSEDLFYGGLYGLLYYDLCRMKVLRQGKKEASHCAAAYSSKLTVPF